MPYNTTLVLGPGACVLGPGALGEQGWQLVTPCAKARWRIYTSGTHAQAHTQMLGKFVLVFCGGVAVPSWRPWHA